MRCHVRIARATNDLAALARFYSDGLGFERIAHFQGHEGFDGLMLGHRDMGYHLEFTREAKAVAPRAPGAENLLVFYLPELDAWRHATQRIETVGFVPVRSHNPYWDRGGKTYEDPDGYRVVLYHGDWNP
jgi:catechol 2,3-dioxygenase-like lactoylglutathione lyase family enzyme